MQGFGLGGGQAGGVAAQRGDAGFEVAQDVADHAGGGVGEAAHHFLRDGGGVAVAPGGHQRHDPPAHGVAVHVFVVGLASEAGFQVVEVLQRGVGVAGVERGDGKPEQRGTDRAVGFGIVVLIGGGLRFGEQLLGGVGRDVAFDRAEFFAAVGVGGVGGGELVGALEVEHAQRLGLEILGVAERHAGVFPGGAAVQALLLEHVVGEEQAVLAGGVGFVVAVEQHLHRLFV